MIESSNFYYGSQTVTDSGPTPGSTTTVDVRVKNTDLFSWSTSGAWYSFHDSPSVQISTITSPSSGTCSAGDSIDIFFNAG